LSGQQTSTHVTFVVSTAVDLGATVLTRRQIDVR